MRHPKAKNTYGTVELEPDEFDPRYAKEKVTLWVNEQLLKALKRHAKLAGVDYECLIHEAIKKFVLEDI